jgi:hypothetical protein
MPTLADVYSAIDTAKRRGSDFLQNPVTSLQQMLGSANDRAREFNQQADLAASEFQKTGKISGPQQMELAQQLASGYSPAGMTVWHGSPYKFKAFDPAKIGTGEGAQAYGHGIYVAENPNVAKGYAQNVKDLNSIQEYNAKLKRLSKVMDEDSVYPGAYRNFKSAKGQEAANEYDNVLEQKLQKAQDPGNLYQIDLPDQHINKMLDWDTPLHQQPKNVQDALGKLGYVANKSKVNEYDDALLSALQGGSTTLPKQPLNPTGEAIYKKLGPPQLASQKLAELGIPGIKYLDQGSRDAQAGTRNFVLFPGNEGLLGIQNINGGPLQ